MIRQRASSSALAYGQGCRSAPSGRVRPKHQRSSSTRQLVGTGEQPGRLSQIALHNIGVGERDDSLRLVAVAVLWFGAESTCSSPLAHG